VLFSRVRSEAFCGRGGRERRWCRDVHHVCVQSRGSSVRRFRHEEEESQEAEGHEDGEEVEGPLPPDVLGDHADEDWSQECAAEDGRVHDRHAGTTLVHKVEIADDGVGERFEGGEGDALEDSRPKQGGVVFVVVSGTTPCRSDGHEQRSEQKDMSLAPDSCRRDEDDGADYAAC